MSTCFTPKREDILQHHRNSELKVKFSSNEANLSFYVLKKNKLYSFKKNNKRMERKQKGQENVSIIVYKVGHPFTFFVVKIQIKNVFFK